MSKKIWLGTAAGKGFATRYNVETFKRQRGLQGNIVQHPNGTWMLDVSGQSFPSEYSSRAIGTPEAIRAATGQTQEQLDASIASGKASSMVRPASYQPAHASNPLPTPTPSPANTPAVESAESLEERRERSWAEFDEVETPRPQPQPQPSKKGSQKRPKRSKAPASTSAPAAPPARPLAPYAMSNGYLDANRLAEDFDIATIDSLLRDKELTPEEKESLSEVRAGLHAQNQYQKILDTASDKASWREQARMTADSRSYDLYNKNIGKVQSPLEQLQTQFRNKMDADAQSNFDDALRLQTEGDQLEASLALERWRQRQSDEQQAQNQWAKERQTISNQENNIGLARWRQGQQEEAKQQAFALSEQERLDAYFQNPTHESVMDVLRGKIVSRTKRTNAASIRTLRQSLGAVDLTSQEDAYENNIGLAKWRQEQREAAKAEAAEIRAEETTEDQVNNIGLAKWRQKQMEEYQHLLSSQGIKSSAINNEDDLHRLVEGMNRLAEEVEENTEELEEANGSNDDKGGKKKKGSDDEGGSGVMAGLSMMMKPIMLAFEVMGAAAFAASDNAKRELMGSSSAGLSREHYAGLVNKIGLGTSIGGDLTANASNAIMAGLRNPDSIATSLEQALTANALLGGPQLDAAGIVKAQLSGDTAGLMNIMHQFGKVANPMQNAAVTGVYGLANLKLSEADGFSLGDNAYRSGTDEGIWRAREQVDLMMANTLGGDGDAAKENARSALAYLGGSMSNLAAETDKVVAGFAQLASQKLLGGDGTTYQNDGAKTFAENARAKLGAPKEITRIKGSLPYEYRAGMEPTGYEGEVGDWEEQENGRWYNPVLNVYSVEEGSKSTRQLSKATAPTHVGGLQGTTVKVEVTGMLNTSDGQTVPLKGQGREQKVTGAGGK